MPRPPIIAKGLRQTIEALTGPLPLVVSAEEMHARLETMVNRPARVGDRVLTLRQAYDAFWIDVSAAQ